MEIGKDFKANDKMESALEKFKRKYKQGAYGNINKADLEKLINALDKKIKELEDNNKQ